MAIDTFYVRATCVTSILVFWCKQATCVTKRVRDLTSLERPESFQLILERIHSGTTFYQSLDLIYLITRYSNQRMGYGVLYAFC
jgi:hypothetical protein